MLQSPNLTWFRFCEDLAREILGLYRLRFNDQNTLPVPIQDIAGRLCKLEVVYTIISKSGPEISGAILSHESRIILNVGESDRRNRFTIAHEIAHWALEKSQQHLDTTLHFNNQSNEVEEISDCVAGALLMPQDLLLKEIRKFDLINGASVKILSDQFQVSHQAMLYRIAYLQKNLVTIPKRVDWNSLRQLDSDIQQNNARVYLERQEQTKAGNKSKNPPKSDQLLGKDAVWGYPEVIQVAVAEMMKSGVGSSLRTSKTLGDKTGVHRPAKGGDRPFVIELAGPPNAGKDTQSDILMEYFKNVRGYRVMQIQESFSKCFVEGITRYDKYLWSLLSTLQSFLYDRLPRFDVIIVNRGLFDLLAMLEFHHAQKLCTQKEYNSVANFILLPTWRELIDIVFLLPIDPQRSIEREEEQQRNIVADLALNFDPLTIPKPPQNIVNSATLAKINLAYDRAYEKYGTRFKKVHILKDNGELTVRETSNKLVEVMTGDLPPAKEQIVDPRLGTLITPNGHKEELKIQQLELFEL